jgi:hypothetical protein
MTLSCIDKILRLVNILVAAITCKTTASQHATTLNAPTKPNSISFRDQSTRDLTLSAESVN